MDGHNLLVLSNQFCFWNDSRSHSSSHFSKTMLVLWKLNEEMFGGGMGEAFNLVRHWGESKDRVSSYCWEVNKINLNNIGSPKSKTFNWLDFIAFPRIFRIFKKWIYLRILIGGPSPKKRNPLHAPTCKKYTRSDPPHHHQNWWPIGDAPPFDCSAHVQ